MTGCSNKVAVVIICFAQLEADDCPLRTSTKLSVYIVFIQEQLKKGQIDCSPSLALYI